mgnify:CR=1 FL=1
MVLSHQRLRKMVEWISANKMIDPTEIELTKDGGNVSITDSAMVIGVIATPAAAPIAALRTKESKIIF